jgi:hypothetical protein
VPDLKSQDFSSSYVFLTDCCDFLTRSQKGLFTILALLPFVLGCPLGTFRLLLARDAYVDLRCFFTLPDDILASAAEQQGKVDIRTPTYVKRRGAVAETSEERTEDV